MNHYLNFASAYSCYCIEGDEEGDDKKYTPAIYFESDNIIIIPDEKLNQLQTRLSYEEEQSAYYSYNIRILKAVLDVLDGDCSKSNLYVVKHAIVDWPAYHELSAIDNFKQQFVQQVLLDTDEFLDASKLSFQLESFPDSLCDHIGNLLNADDPVNYAMTANMMREDFENHQDKIQRFRNQLVYWKKRLEEAPMKIRQASDQANMYKQQMITDTWHRIDRWFRGKGIFKSIVSCQNIEDFYVANRYLLTYIFGPQTPNGQKSTWQTLTWNNETCYIVELVYDVELVCINYQLTDNNETLITMGLICPDHMIDTSIFVTWLKITGNKLSVRFTRVG